MNTSSHQPIPDPIPLARNALIGGLAGTAGAIAITAYEFYMAALTQQWQLYVLGASTLLLALVCLWSVWLTRRGRSTSGMALVFLVAPFSFLTHAIFATDLGFALSLAAFGIALSGPPILLPHRYYPRVVFIAVLTSLAILVADALPLPFRVHTFDPLTRAILTSVASLVLLNLVMLAFQFRIHPLRNKIILAVTVIAALSATVVAGISTLSTRAALHQTANQTLLAAAAQTASSLEYFITSNLEAIDAEAQLPAVQAFLLSPADQRTPAVETELHQLLNSLKNKEVRGAAAGSQTDSLIQSYSLVDADGRVVFDTTTANTGQDWSSRNYLQAPLADSRPYVSPLEFSENNQAWLYFAAPVVHDTRPIGVLVVRFDALVLQRIIGTTQNLQGLAGAGSYAVLLDEHHLHLAHGQDPDQPAYLFQTAGPLDPAEVSSLQAAGLLPRHDQLSANISGLSEGLTAAVDTPAFTFKDQQVSYFASAVRMNNQPWWVVYAQPENALFSTVGAQFDAIQLAALMVTGFAALAAILLTNILAAPIGRLTRFTEKIVSGDVQTRAIPESNDEIGELAMAFNMMTEQLQNNIANLERRVEDRTVELRQRSAYLEASATVSQAAASILNPDQLINRSVELIQERFELYYAGLFIVDETHEVALLRAGTGEAGKRMLERGHSLRLDERSMIGWAITRGQARIALQAGEDPVRLSTSELPDTRSEAALPLRSRGRVLGALTVQSNRVNAFDPEMIAVLQVMADQVAVALDNARLFAESQGALEASRRAYGEVSHSAWQEMLSYRPDLGFASVEGSLRPAGSQWAPETDQAIRLGATVTGSQNGGETSTRSSLAVPIKVRGSVVGVLDTYKPGADAQWTAEEIATIEAITEQLSVALDSARLYSETQLQAERERMVAEITTHMRETLDVETVLKTAAKEIYTVLGLQDVIIRLENPDQA